MICHLELHLMEVIKKSTKIIDLHTHTQISLKMQNGRWSKIEQQQQYYQSQSDSERQPKREFSSLFFDVVGNNCKRHPNLSNCYFTDRVSKLLWFWWYPITNVGGVKSYHQARSIDVALFSASHIQRCAAVKLMVQLDSNSSVLFSLVYLLSFDKNHSLNCLVPILQKRSTFKARFGVI